MTPWQMLLMRSRPASVAVAAGFGKKWSQVARQLEKVRYVVCNGDEGDPGAFMDGSVMEGDPYKMIEGMVIAAYAVGAEMVIFYVRAEYPFLYRDPDGH